MEYVGRNYKQLIINLLGFSVVLIVGYTLLFWKDTSFYTALSDGVTYGLIGTFIFSLAAFLFFPTYKMKISGSKEYLESALKQCPAYRKKLKKKYNNEWEIVTNLFYGDLNIKFIGDHIELYGPKPLIMRVKRKCKI